MDIINFIPGWSYNGPEIEKHAAIQGILQTDSLAIKDSGAGKDVFIFEIERQLTGRVRPPHFQKIGDCVSHGCSGAAEDLQFVQMAKDPTLTFQWVSSEVVYGLARHQIGQDGCGRGDGAVVAWGIQAMQKYGNLPRGKYGQYDLTNYDANLAKSFGAPRAGCPTDLAKLATSNPVKEAKLIQGSNLYEQARDVIANGGLIVTGSNQLYSSQRDSQGFCQPQGRGGHCTYFRGVSDNSKRPGIIYQQSWGPDIPSQGEQRVTLPSGRDLILPAGAFLVDAENFERMHSRGDSEIWGVTSEVGFVKPDSDIQFVFHN